MLSRFPTQNGFAIVDLYEYCVALFFFLLEPQVCLPEELSGLESMSYDSTFAVYETQQTEYLLAVSLKTAEQTHLLSLYT
jgi:hypothetical protein